MYESYPPKPSGAGCGVLTQQLALLKELTVRIHEDEKTLRLASRRCRRSHRQRRAFDWGETGLATPRR
jgi:hypothetical protein